MKNDREKLGNSWDSTRDANMYRLYVGSWLYRAIWCIILGTTSIRYPPKGTHPHFPFDRRTKKTHLHFWFGVFSLRAQILEFRLGFTGW